MTRDEMNNEGDKYDEATRSQDSWLGAHVLMTKYESFI